MGLREKARRYLEEAEKRLAAIGRQLGLVEPPQIIDMKKEPELTPRKSCKKNF